MLKSFFHGLAGLIYPPNCLLCRSRLGQEEQENLLCPLCADSIKPNRPPFCGKCSRPLREDFEQNFCRDCRQTEYDFNRAWAATLYNDTMKTLIHFFKYENKTSLRKTFSKLISVFLNDHAFELARFDYLVPVPLHRARLRERGYNQSELILEPLRGTLGVPLASGKLLRKRYTPNQALLGKKERWTNIRGAFTINDSLFFKEKSVLLFDDLFTTGATVSEAARTLKNAGAKEVSVLTLAITA